MQQVSKLILSSNFVMTVIVENARVESVYVLSKISVELEGNVVLIVG